VSEYKPDRKREKENILVEKNGTNGNRKYMRTIRIVLYLEQEELVTLSALNGFVMSGLYSCNSKELFIWTSNQCYCGINCLGKQTAWQQNVYQQILAALH
jgi:hypothetical protein